MRRYAPATCRTVFRSFDPRTIIGLLFVLLLVVACDSAGSGAAWAGTTETLPNGAVRVTNPAEALWNADNAWQLERELVIGRTEGAGADVFASVSALAVDGAGNIYVLDRQTNDLRIFDSTGAHVRSVGRAGEGPGEYRAANGLAWISVDSLVVVDQRGNRYSVLDRNGDHVRSVPRQLSFFGWVFNGNIDGDVIYEVSGVGRGDDRVPALLGTRLRGDSLQTGEVSDAAGTRTDIGQFPVDTVLLARPAGPLYQAYTVQNERGGMSMGVPFAGRPYYYLDGNGGIWFGHGGATHLYHTTLQGDTLAEIILATEPTPVTQDEIDEWLGESMVAEFKSRGGKLDVSRIPSTKPYFDGITIGERGFIWLTVPTPPMQTLFVVLDQDGRYLGQLRIDGTAREQYVPPIVRNDHLYFIGRDDLDVQRVYVYRVIGANR